MQINPLIVIERGIITGVDDLENQIQQVGIDLRIKTDVKIFVGGSVNVEIQEQFNMQNTFGLIRVRSSLSRKGIFISSGIYDPGFCGIGGITLYNLGGSFPSPHPTYAELPAKTRICQMIVFEADAAKSYDGHYNRSDSIESKGA